MIGGQSKGFLVKGAGSFDGRNRKRDGSNDWPMIRERINLKKSDRRGSFTVNYLPGAGGGATVFGQRRGVNIDNFMGENVNSFLVEKGRAKGNTQTEIGL